MLEETHKDHQFPVPGRIIHDWEHCPGAPWGVAGLVPWPFPWAACPSAQPDLSWAYREWHCKLIILRMSESVMCTDMWLSGCFSNTLPWPTECQLLGDSCFHQHWTSASSECVKKEEHPVGRYQGACSEQRDYCNKDTEEKKTWMRATRNIGAYYRKKKKSPFLRVHELEV